MNKLILNKKTIAHLNAGESIKIRGGCSETITDESLEPSCLPSECCNPVSKGTCHTDCGTCYCVTLYCSDTCPPNCDSYDCTIGACTQATC